MRFQSKLRMSGLQRSLTPKSKHVQQHFTGVFESVECSLCAQLAHELKLLTCGHKICKTCISKLIAAAESEGATEITCPLDSIVTAAPTQVPSIFYGLLNCQLCEESKPVTDIWWCGVCARYFCSHCQITDHGSRNHPEIVKWDSAVPVRDASSRLHSFPPSTSSQNTVFEEKKQQFVSSLEALLEKVVQVVTLKLTPSSPAEPEGYERILASLLQTHYVLPSGGGSGCIEPPDLDSAARLVKVAEAALGLARISLPKKPQQVENKFDDYIEKLGKLDSEAIARVIIAELTRPSRNSVEAPKEKPPPPPPPPAPVMYSERGVDIGDRDTIPLVQGSDLSLHQLDLAQGPALVSEEGKTNIGGDWWKFSQESVLSDRAGAGGSRFGLDNLDENQINGGVPLSPSTLKETVAENGGERRIVFDFDSQFTEEEKTVLPVDEEIDEDLKEELKNKKDFMTKIKRKLSKNRKPF